MVQPDQRADGPPPAAAAAVRAAPTQAPTHRGALPLTKIDGFESTDYRLLHGRIVWAGAQACTEHPRNAWRPWRPEPLACDARRLRSGARICLRWLDAAPHGSAKGLLPWLSGRPLPFPLNHAKARFDAIGDALARHDLDAFEVAALRVLGLGHGLTPSGDDFIGGVFFALAHAPRAAWASRLPLLTTRIRTAAQSATNVISAALLDDLIDGAGYGALHELLAALQGNTESEIERAVLDLLRVGATSGADMLAGLLPTLTTTR